MFAPEQLTIHTHAHIGTHTALVAHLLASLSARRYKILRGVFLEGCADAASVVVPSHVRDGITSMIGDDDGAAAYASLLGLVRAENGVH